MSLLLESIKCLNGQLYNLRFHEERMERAMEKVYHSKTKFNLKKLIKIPAHASIGLYKCRIVYDNTIQEIQFEKYRRRTITDIKLIHDENISYSHKYTDRECILKHTQNFEKGEEAIFVKKGLLRDASYSNIALFNGKEWHTPTYPLLKGTKRAELLARGILKSKKLKPTHLINYNRICFLNAMNDLNELYLEL